MKKVLFVVSLATLLAAGCQKTQIINPVEGDAMTFSTRMGKLTKVPKAESSGEENLYEQDFKVWAYCAYADGNNGVHYGDPYDGMTGLDVTTDDNGASWETDKDYYWPGTDKKLDFFAVSTSKAWASPAAGDTPAVEGVSCVPTNGGAEDTATNPRSMTVSGYAVDNANPNDDLMVAEFVRQDQGMNGKNVKLHFKHALSKVTFKFATNSTTTETVTVKSLSVAGLKTKGTLTVSETEEAYEDNTGRVEVSLAWTPDKDETTGQNFADDYDGDMVLDPQAAGAAPFTTWLVLPQDITGKTVSIAYSITSDQGTRDFEQTFALTRSAVEEVKDDNGNVTTEAKDAFNKWEINQVITYTINLSPNKIAFTPSVEKWDDETVYSDQN